MQVQVLSCASRCVDSHLVLFLKHVTFVTCFFVCPAKLAIPIAACQRHHPFHGADASGHDSANLVNFGTSRYFPWEIRRTEMASYGELGLFDLASIPNRILP